MTRKSPFEHKVNGHYRSGKFIETYDRGSGKKPKNSMRSVKPVRSMGMVGGYVVTLSGDGESETYKGYGGAGSSLRQAVGKLQRAIVPTRAVLRRIK